MARIRAYNIAFDQVITAAKKEKVDFVIHTGDLFDTNRPVPRSVQYVNKRLTSLANLNIPFIFIRGNHDGSYVGFGVHSGTACDYITKIRSEKSDQLKIDNEVPDFPILIDPELHTRHANLAFKSVVIKDELEITGCGYSGSNSRKFIQEEVLSKSASWKYPVFLLFHDYMKGLTTVPEGVSTISIDDITSISDKIKYVGVGHDHTYKERILNNIQFVSTGSTEPYDFGEVNADHYYVVGEFSDDEIKLEKRKIKPLHYMRYEVIETKQAQSASWFKDQIKSKINDFIDHKTKRKKIIKIVPKGPLKPGNSLYDLQISSLEESLQKEEIIFSAIDISNIIPPELISGDIEQPILISPKSVFSKLKVSEADTQMALDVFNYTQQLLDDDMNLTSTGNLKKNVEDAIKLKIEKMWSNKGGVETD